MREPDSNGIGWYARHQAFPQCQRFAFCLADDGAARPKNPDLLQIAFFRYQRLVEVVALFGHQRDGFHQAEHVVGDARGSTRPAGSASGLNNDWVPLGRRNHAERTLDLEELADVVDGADLCRIGNLRGLLVPHKSVRIYAAPQFAADVDELLETIVTAFVIDQFVVAVIGIVGAPLREVITLKAMRPLVI